MREPATGQSSPGIRQHDGMQHDGIQHDGIQHDAPRQDIVLALPPSAPRMRDVRITRWIGRSVLRLGGWRMAGAFPDIPRLVLIGAPHSSNWDGIWGFAAKLALGLDLRILGKRELFWWPLGALLRRSGMLPVDRESAHGVVEHIATLMGRADKFWVGLAPEGTRKPVDRWKAGFWKIAKAANVPVLPAYFHYPDKVIGIGPPFVLTDDMAADIARIRAWYAPWQGRHHNTQ